MLIDVYVDSDNRPQHLASPNELPEYAKNPTDKELYHSACGEDSSGLSVKKLPGETIKMKCEYCAGQLDMYLDIQ